MLATVEVRPEGTTRTASPGLTVPLAIKSAEASKVEIRPAHPLHRHAEGFGLIRGHIERHRFQMLDQRHDRGTKAFWPIAW